jgi:hypothetical protein
MRAMYGRTGGGPPPSIHYVYGRRGDGGARLYRGRGDGREVEGYGLYGTCEDGGGGERRGWESVWLWLVGVVGAGVGRAPLAVAGG